MKNWDAILGAGSIVLMLIAVILLLSNFKEGRFYFLALAFYLLQVTFLNLDSTRVFVIPDAVRGDIVFFHSILELPTLIVFFLYFAEDQKMRKLIFYTIGAYILFDLIVCLFLGLTDPALTIIIGPGLALITGFSFYFFVEHLKLAISKRMETGKAFLTGATVFAYLCFTLIYILYYLMQSQYINDIYAIYYSTYIIFAVFLITGLLLIMSAKRQKAKSQPIKKENRKEDENSFQFL